MSTLAVMLLRTPAWPAIRPGLVRSCRSMPSLTPRWLSGSASAVAAAAADSGLADLQCQW